MKSEIEELNLDPQRERAISVIEMIAQSFTKHRRQENLRFQTWDELPSRRCQTALAVFFN